MEDIRQALIKGEGNKLTKKEYKFAVIEEKKRLFQQLIFLTFVSFMVGVILFVSLYVDISELAKTNSLEWDDASSRQANQKTTRI